MGGRDTLSLKSVSRANELGVLLPLVEGEWRRDEASLRSV
jgi:hypothetical protein